MRHDHDDAACGDDERFLTLRPEIVNWSPRVAAAVGAQDCGTTSCA